MASHRFCYVTWDRGKQEKKFDNEEQKRHREELKWACRLRAKNKSKQKIQEARAEQSYVEACSAFPSVLNGLSTFEGEHARSPISISRGTSHIPASEPFSRKVDIPTSSFSKELYTTNPSISEVFDPFPVLGQPLSSTGIKLDPPAYSSQPGALSPSLAVEAVVPLLPEVECTGREVAASAEYANAPICEHPFSRSNATTGSPIPNCFDQNSVVSQPPSSAVLEVDQTLGPHPHTASSSLFSSLDSTIVSLSAVDRIDYLKPVIGYELSDRCPQVNWPGGIATALPFIPDAASPDCNLLGRDAQFVSLMAKAEDGRTSELVCYHDYAESTSDKLVKVCRAELAHNKVVVITTDPSSPTEQTEEAFDAMYFRKKLGYGGKGRFFEIHDALQRLENPEAPQIKGQLDVLLANVTDHSKVQCILDMPTRTSLIPPLIDPMNDGATSFQEIQDIYPEPTIPQDMHDGQSWLLAHTAGFLTYPHHDTGGLATYLDQRNGCKEWVVYRPSGYATVMNRKDLDLQHQKFKDKEGGPGELSGFGIKHDANCESAVIHAQPNTILIMPPGMFHAVYTPIRGVSHGGHLLLYDTLHLTEVARAYNNKRARFVTNTDHVSVERTLAHMAIALLRISDMTFYRKPIIVLCVMIKKPSNYTPNTSSATYFEQLDAACNNQEMRDSVVVVDTLIKGLSLQPYFQANGPDYLFEGDVDWMDPGPVIDIGSALAGFDPEHPFNDSDANDDMGKRKRKQRQKKH